MSDKTARVLRPLSEKGSEQISTIAIAPQKESAQIVALKAQAAALGMILYERDKLSVDVGQQIASRMKQRAGKDVYQTRAFSVPNMPLDFCTGAFPHWRLTTDTPRIKTWRWENDDYLCMLTSLAPFMATQGAMCSGLTKALQTESEYCVRVLASALTPFEVSWVAQPRGVDRLYFNFMYALVTETGEFHSPKDDDRREIALSPALIRSVPEQALTDAMAMHRAGVVLAPNFLRAMGLEQEAMHRESIIWQQQDTIPHPQKGKRISKQPKWNVEAILDQRGNGAGRQYLVQWEGYEPSWEAWRQQGLGEVGDPLQTWEPQCLVKDTEALQQWELQQWEEEGEGGSSSQ